MTPDGVSARYQCHDTQQNSRPDIDFCITNTHTHTTISCGYLCENPENELRNFSNDSYRLHNSAQISTSKGNVSCKANRPSSNIIRSICSILYVNVYAHLYIYAYMYIFYVNIQPTNSENSAILDGFWEGKNRILHKQQINPEYM